MTAGQSCYIPLHCRSTTRRMSAARHRGHSTPFVIEKGNPRVCPRTVALVLTRRETTGDHSMSREQWDEAGGRQTLEVEALYFGAGSTGAMLLITCLPSCC